MAKLILKVLSVCILFLSCNCLTAFAEINLPDGSVRGLPEKLVALDDEGKAVSSDTGEYFFRVENMEYGVTYSKNVQLMNLREDAVYHIYFYVEPLFKSGEIDLEKGCECTFFLDQNQIYKGDVSGNGTIDLTRNVIDCGQYYPGESHVLRCEVIWNDLDVIQNVDNGHRLVDKDGTHVLTGPNESGHAEGEIEFKWIFYASVDVEGVIENGVYVPTKPANDVKNSYYSADNQIVSEGKEGENGDENGQDGNSGNGTGGNYSQNQNSGFFSPFTGRLAKNGRFWILCIGAITVLIAVMLVLMYIEKRKQKNKLKDNEVKNS